jgi:hypothetical protein
VHGFWMFESAGRRPQDQCLRDRFGGSGKSSPHSIDTTTTGFGNVYTTPSGKRPRRGSPASASSPSASACHGHTSAPASAWSGEKYPRRSSAFGLLFGRSSQNSRRIRAIGNFFRHFWGPQFLCGLRSKRGRPTLYHAVYLLLRSNRQLDLGHCGSVHREQGRGRSSIYLRRGAAE